jgi:putative phosphoribosyl transferase
MVGGGADGGRPFAELLSEHMRIPFRNRTEAGQQLAKLLERNRGTDTIVLALPRGGVPVAYEIARFLDAPLEVLVRKLGLPGHEELAIGAIASGGVRVLNPDVVGFWGVEEPVLEIIVEREVKELERREREYRGDRPAPKLERRDVILVDDGLATGASMQAAIQALRRFNPRRIVVAVPVAPPSTCREFRRYADDVVCAATPEPFYSVGSWYEDFSQTSDDEVRHLLKLASHERVG